MKSFLVVGMGTFGHHLCRELAAQNCEIMAVDSRPEMLEDVLGVVTSAKIADCTSEEALRSFDIPSFDACFVCTGGNFQNSLEITSLLKELGAQKVFSKAEEDVQAKFLLRIGADEVIYPEADIASRIAVRESSDSIFDCIPLSKEYAIYEITPHAGWIGKTIGQLDFRGAYALNILASKKDGVLQPMPTVDYMFKKDEHLVVMGTREAIHRAVER